MESKWLKCYVLIISDPCSGINPKLKLANPDFNWKFSINPSATSQSCTNQHSQSTSLIEHKPPLCAAELHYCVVACGHHDPQLCWVFGSVAVAKVQGVAKAQGIRTITQDQSMTWILEMKMKWRCPNLKNSMLNQVLNSRTCFTVCWTQLKGPGVEPVHSDVLVTWRDVDT